MTTSLVISIAAVALVACAGSAGRPGQSDAPDGTPAASRQPSPSTAPPSEDAPTSDAAVPSLPSGEVPTAMLEGVIAQAASGAGISADEIAVVAAEAVTWSDGSLGCPQEGMEYTQALVPGYRVVLEVDGDELYFHASEAGDFRYCANPQPPAASGTTDR